MHLPVSSLRAAVGCLANGHEVERWLDISGPQGSARLRDVVISLVVGGSMDPCIPGGSYRVFRRLGAAARQGKIVPAQHGDISDPRPEVS